MKVPNNENLYINIIYNIGYLYNIAMNRALKEYKLGLITDFVNAAKKSLILFIF
jgi:hypothetical protein